MADEKLDEWEDVKGSSDYWDPLIGDTIEGTIKSFKEDGQYGVQAVLTSGEKDVLLPAHKVLQSKLMECEVGDHIKVTYVKDEPPAVKGRKPTRIYTLLRKKK